MKGRELRRPWPLSTFASQITMANLLPLEGFYLSHYLPKEAQVPFPGFFDKIGYTLIFPNAFLSLFVNLCNSGKYFIHVLFALFYSI